MRAWHGALVALAAAGCSGDGPGTVPPPVPPCTFLNPIATGADPWVVRDGGQYYMVQSRGRSIWVSRSDKLTEVHANAVQVWSAPDTGWNRDHVWAPELHRIGDRWYIYYAAGREGPPFVHQRSGVLESVSTDPQGAYTDRGMLYTGDGGPASGGESVWAIDLTVGAIGGQLYAFWSGWQANAATDRTPQHLYAARMASPTQVGGPRVRISSPEAAWERGAELDLQEGPQLLQRNGATFLVYSTRESWRPDYRLGQLRLTGADPLDPAAWTKRGPVFEATGEVFGPGHASFTRSPDGTEDWIVYHAKTGSAPGWDDRVVRMQEFTWNADGSPNFGIPVGPSQRVPRPSGECAPA